jgi:predicted kinase
MKKANPLIIMVGAPASGKSTYAKKIKEESDKPINIISRDKIRFSLLQENDKYFAKEDEVYDIFIDEIARSLHDGITTIADATHLTKGSRVKLLASLSYVLTEDYDDKLMNYSIVACVMDTPYLVCKERNDQRKGRLRVPDTVLNNMCADMTIPNFRKEPLFDEIEEIRWTQ